MMTHHTHHHLRHERGFVSTWTALSMLAFIIVVGIGVDFSGHASMTQDARAIADEAARAGGQQLQIIKGHAHLDAPKAIKAAKAHATNKTPKHSPVTTNRDLLEGQAEVFHTGIIRAIDPDAKVTFEFTDGK